MKVIKCDCCGEVVEIHQARELLVVDKHDYMLRVAKDICPVCYRKVANVLSMKED